MKHIKQVFTLAIALITVSAFAQKKPGNKTQTTKSQTQKTQPYNVSPLGLKYKMYKSGKGTKAKVGDIVKVHLVNKTEKDSILSSTYTDNNPITLEVTKPSFKGDLMEGFTFMAVGDSGSFLVSVDSLAQGNPLPPFLKAGDFLKFDVKLVEINSKEEYEKTQDELVANQAATIEKYAKDNKLQVKKTSTGLYYVIDKQGTGANAKAGDNVSVHYKGYTLDGKVFDESYSRGEPISFPLGQGQVIPGWDEGIQLFNKGGKGKLLIPSPLAYGAGGSGPIAPNSVLIFDIELVDIK